MPEGLLVENLKQARSQDFFEGGLRGCLMCMYAYINKHARLGGSGGMLPQEIFRN